MRVITDTANLCGKKGTDFYLLFEVYLNDGKLSQCSKMLDMVDKLGRARKLELDAVQTAMDMATYVRSYDKLEMEQEALVNQVFALQSLKADMVHLIDKAGE